MMSKRTSSWGVVVSVLAFLLFAIGAQGQEVGVDRPGRDLRPGFDLPTAEPELCKKACDGDANCKAYTYVKPGVQGPNARCWLKSGVPAAVKNDCCVSGVRELTAQSTGILRAIPAPGLRSAAPPSGPGAACAPLAFASSSPLPSTGLRWDYSHQLQVSGGYPPVTFGTYRSTDKGTIGSLTPGDLYYWAGLRPGYTGPPVEPAHWANSYLPLPGLKLTGSGLIHGQPAMTGYFNVIIVATDSCPGGVQRTHKLFALQITEPK